ncbi:MAG: apiosidase-like domain-containing protein [bacterium]
MLEITIWTIFEAYFIASMEYENPHQGVLFQVRFISPRGKEQIIDGFWDGEKNWKIRFSPDEIGKWSFQTKSSDKGLDDQKGEFTCIPYTGNNPLYKHGAIKVSDNRRYLIHSDGEPFFWLSDTAWNGVLLSDENGWQKYLQDRVSKGFTAIQFVTTQWRAAMTDADGNVAFTGTDKIQINPVFFQRMDRMIGLINKCGLIAAPVMIWACTRKDPGQTVTEDQLILLAKYMVARYGAYQVIWFLGGDGNYMGNNAEKWKRIGRAVFGDNYNRLVTMHPGGMQWVDNEFRNEKWFSFNGYQSGHGDDEPALRWLCEGPPAKDWKKEPHHPYINLEPNYEGHISYQSRKVFTDRDVRRAIYWSLLVSPTAGVSYGAHGIWSWQLEEGVPLDHPGSGIASPWYEAMKMPGSMQIKYVKDFFSHIKWWKLMPAPELSMEQPGIENPRKFVASAISEDCAILYLTEGMDIKVNTKIINGNKIAKWFDPRTGIWSEPISVNNEIEIFKAPDNEDWVLWIGKAN